MGGAGGGGVVIPNSEGTVEAERKVNQKYEVYINKTKWLDRH